MTTYSYLATDASGNTKEGTVDAHSLQAAREELKDMGLEAIEIFEAPQDGTPTTAPVDSSPPELSFSGYEAPDTPVEAPKPASTTDQAYFPLLETLRLYAGWLLAWYCLVYAVGSYQFIKEMPFRIPYAESLFLSPLVLSFTFAAYLFLIFSGIYKMLGKKRSVGFVLIIIAAAIFVLYRMNIQ